MNRSRLRRRSRKGDLEHARYVVFVAQVLGEEPYCQVCPLISRVLPSWRGCTHYADGLHHLRKRSQGGALRDRANVLPSCNRGNVWVEIEPTLARQAGLVK